MTRNSSVAIRIMTPTRQASASNFFDFLFRLFFALATPSFYGKVQSAVLAPYAFALLCLSRSDSAETGSNAHASQLAKKP
jgi:hypothetical protein